MTGADLRPEDNRKSGRKRPSDRQEYEGQVRILAWQSHRGRPLRATFIKVWKQYTNSSLKGLANLGQFQGVRERIQAALRQSYFLTSSAVLVTAPIAVVCAQPPLGNPT